jgi:predicted dehydrogenase
MKFAVYGCQHFHIRAFIDEMLALGHEFVGICDTGAYPLPERAAAQYRVPLFHSEEALLDRGVELIGTAARNDRKIEVVEWAERHGIHVMADKPIVTDERGLQRLQRIVDRGKIQVGLMLTARFSPAQTALVDFTFLKPHKLDRAQRPEWFFHRSFNGGLVVDLMIHDADMLHWFTGKDVIASHGVLVKNILPELPEFYDNAQVQVLLEGNITAAIKSDWLMPEVFPTWGDGRIFVTGTAGRAEIRTAGDVLAPDGPFLLFAPHSRKPERVPAEKPKVGLCEDFINRIRGLPHHVTAQDMIRCSKTVLKINASCTWLTGKGAGS